MLESKKGNMVIALILAIVLWVYVVGEMDPLTKKTYRNIPITLTNEQILTEEGLAVIKTSDSEMNVTVSGKRSDLAEVEITDVTATVDLTDAGEGDNQLKVVVRVPNTVDVEDQTLEKITVSVGKLVSEEREVRVNYTGSTGGDMEPTVTDIDPETVTVTGSEPQVAKVAYVSAELDLEDVLETESSVNCRLIPVNENGNEVSNVTLSQEKARVTTVLYDRKTIPLEVPVVDKGSTEYTRTTSAPDQVTVAGPADALAGITSVTAESIDISDITEDQKISIKINLPDQVYLAGSSTNLKLEVKVGKTAQEESRKTEEEEETPKEETKELTLDQVTVIFTGLSEGLSAELQESDVKITITGTKDQLDQIAEGDVSLTADCTDLDAGTHTLKLSVSCEKSVGSIAAEPEEVTVVITEG